MDNLLAATVNLVNGFTVAVTDRDGQIEPGRHLGLYHRDVRVLSKMTVTVDQRPPPLLSSTRHGADTARQVWAVKTDLAGVPTAVLIRTRTIAATMSDAYELLTFEGPLTCQLSLELQTDFAALHKGVSPAPVQPYHRSDDELHVRSERAAVMIHSPDHTLAPTDQGWSATLSAVPDKPAGALLQVVPSWDDAPVLTPPPADTDLHVDTRDRRWKAAIQSAVADVNALTILDAQTDLPVPAAGAPWFMALFGRDSLLTSYNRLIADVEGAVTLLEVLAHYQGQRDVPHRLEQPGRILHELRTGGLEVFTTESGEPYYGTVDAPPLFIILLAEAFRFGADAKRVAGLLPAARAAMDWCVGDGDADGDGWIEYGEHTGGLENQGWKDSDNAMVHADGTQAVGPIALCEVQAYLIRARRDLAYLEEELGDAAQAPALRKLAAESHEAFRRDFWLPEDGLIAMALDGDKQPLRVASSNMGHCLWAGAVDEDVAADVGQRLTSADMLSDFGVRTLSARERAYNPLGYHLGSVWPHDNALVAAGLGRYGLKDHAWALIDRLLDVAVRDGGRLPEILGGLDAHRVGGVLGYPSTCSPQAWSATAPLLFLRTILGLDIDVPRGRVSVDPIAPAVADLTVRTTIAGKRLSITCDEQGAATVSFA